MRGGAAVGSARGGGGEGRAGRGEDEGEEAERGRDEWGGASGGGGLGAWEAVSGWRGHGVSVRGERVKRGGGVRSMDTRRGGLRRRSEGVAYNHQGQRVGGHVALGEKRLCWPLTWAKAPMTRADRAGAAAPRAAPDAAARAGRVAMRADAGYFAGSWPAPPTTRTSSSRSARSGSRRVAAAGRDRRRCLARRDRHGQCEVACGVLPGLGTANTRLLIRRVTLDPTQVSADPRSRRRAPCTRTSETCCSRSWRSSQPIYAYSFILTNLDVSSRIRRPPWSTGTDTAPRWRTSSATASSAPLSGTSPPANPQVNLAWM